MIWRGFYHISDAFPTQTPFAPYCQRTTGATPVAARFACLGIPPFIRFDDVERVFLVILELSGVLRIATDVFYGYGDGIGGACAFAGTAVHFTIAKRSASFSTVTGFKSITSKPNSR